MSAAGPQTAVPRRGIFTQELLDQCISCGFCLPACPTHKLTGDETSSPRGRINLMRALESGQLPGDDATVLEESSFCLGCRACEPVCPAGVQYGELLEEWRDHLWNGRRRGAKLRGLLWAVDARWRVRAMGIVRSHARSRPGDGPHLMLGCFERALFPAVSRAARRLAPDLDAPSNQGCCGALHAHNGELERGRELGRELGERLPGTIVTTSGGCAAHLAGVLGPERVQELSQWLVAEGRVPAQPRPAPQGPVAEPVAAAQTDDPALAAAASAGAAEAGREAESRGGDQAGREAGFLGGHQTGREAGSHGEDNAGREAGSPRPSGAPGADGASRRPRIGLQDSCHLRNGLGVHREPREILRTLGDYVELPGAGECCGAAGTYAILRPDDSARVLDSKLDAIERADLDYVVAVNPGCLRQLEQGVRRRKLRTKAIHLAELLADGPRQV